MPDPTMNLSGFNPGSKSPPPYSDFMEKKCEICLRNKPMAGKAHCAHCESEFQERFGKRPGDVTPRSAKRMFFALSDEAEQKEEGLSPAERLVERKKERRAFKEDRRRIREEDKRLPDIDRMVLADSLAQVARVRRERKDAPVKLKADATRGTLIPERDPVANERKIIEEDLIARDIDASQAFGGDNIAAKARLGRYNPRVHPVRFPKKNRPEARKQAIRTRLQDHVLENRDAIIRHLYHRMDTATKNLVQREIADGRIRPELSDYLIAKTVARYNRTPREGEIPKDLMSIDFPERDLDAPTKRPRYERKFYPTRDF